MSTLYLVVGIAGIFAAVFLCMAALTLSDNSARGISKSLAVMEAFSAAPAELRQELEPSFQERVLTPLMDRTLNIGKKLTPADFNERIRHKLEVAGNPAGWTVDRVTSLKFIGFVVAQTSQCPFCIDSFTRQSLENGLSMPELGEAMHAAASLRAGITLAHGLVAHNIDKKLSM